MIGSLIIRFKKNETSDIFEGELYVGLDNEADLDEYINSCLDDIIANVSGEVLDSKDEIVDFEYYFEEAEDVSDEDLDYDWR